MKSFPSTLLLLALLALVFSSCQREDPGPLQDDQRSYGLSGFTNLDLGSAFRVNVRQGATFSVQAKGDRRNLEDLDVWVSNGTLRAKYRSNRNRQYETELDLVMPLLLSADFSGAVNATVRDFSSTGDFSLNVSGASKADVDVRSKYADVKASGASQVVLRGAYTLLEIEASGASLVKAFDAPAEVGDVNASGASSIRVAVSQRLKAVATGASNVTYRGNPAVLDSRPSGGSTIRKE